MRTLPPELVGHGRNDARSPQNGTTVVDQAVWGNQDLPNKPQQAQCPQHSHQTDNPHGDIIGYTLKGAPNRNRPRDVVRSLLLPRLAPVSYHATRLPGLARIDNGSFVETDPLTVVSLFTERNPSQITRVATFRAGQRPLPRPR